uniref:Uncharacterized protein n=1 Tax=Physcomitrium patens TaxID=3218 RepID=A0A2K1KLD9_PHYPA|nr:hypothetical protein PHYPA_008266 [Physcomitrium patens]
MSHRTCHVLSCLVLTCSQTTGRREGGVCCCAVATLDHATARKGGYRGAPTKHFSHPLCHHSFIHSIPFLVDLSVFFLVLFSLFPFLVLCLLQVVLLQFLMALPPSPTPSPAAALHSSLLSSSLSLFMLYAHSLPSWRGTLPYSFSPHTCHTCTCTYFTYLLFSFLKKLSMCPLITTYTWSMLELGTQVCNTQGCPQTVPYHCGK